MSDHSQTHLKNTPSKRLKRVRSRSRKVGLSPGSLVYVGEGSQAKPRIYVVAYDQTNYFEAEAGNIEQALSWRGKGAFLWINIDGIHDVDTVKAVGDFFSFHPLALEDVLNSEQRPKKEEFDDFILVIMRALAVQGPENQLESEQIGIFVGQDYVVSFQEKAGDVFEPIRQRMRNPAGRLRQKGPDYLMYALIDTLVDNYFVVLEKIGEKIERLETELVESPTPATLRLLYELKRDGLFLRRAIWPLREVISALERSENSFVQRSTVPYLRDVYFHSVEVIDTIETYREMLSGMLDIYLSSVSNRMNSVIKVLTIITTIFMPLSFIAGVYGMNFEYMPELKWQFGYPAVLLSMAIVTIGMLLLFRVKKWI